MAIKDYPSAQIPAQTGNSGKYLTTNGSVPSWGSVSLNLTLLNSGNTTVGTSTSKTWTGLDGYDNYYIRFSNLSANSIQDEFSARFNGSSSSNYTRVKVEAGSGSTLYWSNPFTTEAGGDIVFARNGSATDSSYGYLNLQAGKSTGLKPIQFLGGGPGNSTYGTMTYWGIGTCNVTTAISSFSVICSSGASFDAGNVYIYGA